MERKEKEEQKEERNMHSAELTAPCLYNDQSVCVLLCLNRQFQPRRTIMAYQLERRRRGQTTVWPGFQMRSPDSRNPDRSYRRPMLVIRYLFSANFRRPQHWSTRTIPECGIFHVYGRYVSKLHSSTGKRLMLNMMKNRNIFPAR